MWQVVFRKDTKFYVLDSKCESQRRVELHTVLVERGLSWDKALDMYRKALDSGACDQSGEQRWVNE